MKITSNKIVQNWIFILLVMVAGFALIAFYILFSGQRFSEQAADSFYNYNLEDKKKAAKREIFNRLDEINFERNKLLAAEKHKLYEKIHHLAASHLQKNNDFAANISAAQIRDAIIEFENEVAKDKEYLYFAINTEGVLMRSGTDNSITGTNLFNAKDMTGHYYIQTMIKAKDLPDGIYVDYYWPKVKGGEPKKKTSYCLYIPTFDLILGVGVYHDDIQSALRNKIYTKLQSYYENKEHYVFVNEYDSTVRVASLPSLIGKKMSEEGNRALQVAHLKIMDALLSNEEAYVHYQYYPKNSSILSDKIGYVHKLEGWNGYIGTGFHLNELQDEVQNYSHLFKTHYYHQALYIISGLFILSFIAFLLFRRGVALQEASLKQGEIIYKKLSEISHDAIVVVSKTNQLLYENEIARKLFNEQTQSFFDSDSLPFQVVDQDIFSFAAQTSNGRRHYVRIRKERVFYQHQSSNIYFINDITKEYLKSHALTKMAYLDELTGLPNRRALRDSYEDIADEIHNGTTYILGILDIDKFKNINDTYGHAVGDDILCLLSKVFADRLRRNDAIYRYGGEEFVILLNNISLPQAKHLITAINRHFCELAKMKQGFDCTFSCGMIAIDINNKDDALAQQIRLADKLLYKAKENGRNRIEI